MSAGFDFVRLTVDPSIFIEATAENAAEIHQHAKYVISRLLGQGFNVVVDLHPVAVNAEYSPQNLVREQSSPQFRAYADMVERMTLLLRDFPPNRVAFELMNEPAIFSTELADVRRWQTMLEILHKKARASNDLMPLVLSGAQVSDWKGLRLLDVEPFRRSNVLYTFHFYEPYAFTHQGVLRIETQCTAGIMWPEDDANAEDVLAKADACVAATSLGDADRAKLRADTQRLIKGYEGRRFNVAMIGAAFDEVGHWAAQNGIAPSRILLGEFGCVKSATARPLGEQRLLWLQTVASNADRLGFPWAYWGYKGRGGMELLEENAANLDQEVLGALQLHGKG